LEMDWLQKCKQAFVDWDSDEENEEEGRAVWSILEGRKRYKTFFLGEITRFLKWVIYFGKNELFRLKKKRFNKNIKTSYLAQKKSDNSDFSSRTKITRISVVDWK
jgi:hypothetical protein